MTMNHKDLFGDRRERLLLIGKLLARVRVGGLVQLAAAARVGTRVANGIIQERLGRFDEFDVDDEGILFFLVLVEVEVVVGAAAIHVVGGAHSAVVFLPRFGPTSAQELLVLVVVVVHFLQFDDGQHFVLQLHHSVVHFETRHTTIFISRKKSFIQFIINQVE